MKKLLFAFLFFFILINCKKDYTPFFTSHILNISKSVCIDTSYDTVLWISYCGIDNNNIILNINNGYRDNFNIYINKDIKQFNLYADHIQQIITFEIIDCNYEFLKIKIINIKN